MWSSVERKTSRGSRPQKTYETSSQYGTPSNGVCVLTIRRCGCAAYAAITSSSGSRRRSSQRERRFNGCGRRGDPCTRSAHAICVHVVPLLAAVQTMTSPARGRNASQRVVSKMGVW